MEVHLEEEGGCRSSLSAAKFRLCISHGLIMVESLWKYKEERRGKLACDEKGLESEDAIVYVLSSSADQLAACRC